MKTKYDWRIVPDWVNFIAIDRDGKMFGYEKEIAYYRRLLAEIF